MLDLNNSAFEVRILSNPLGNANFFCYVAFMSSSDKKLSQIISYLKKDFAPLRLFLYGSRANGNHRPDSDYDFVMVVPRFDKKNRYEQMSSISSKLFQQLNVEVQVWTYSEEEFLDWKDEFSSIPETAVNTGREIELG